MLVGAITPSGFGETRVDRLNQQPQLVACRPFEEQHPLDAIDVDGEQIGSVPRRPRFPATLIPTPRPGSLNCLQQAGI